MRSRPTPRGLSAATALLTILLPIFLATSAARADDDRWVAFATHDNGAFGLAWGEASSDEAAAQALARCGFERCRAGKPYRTRCIAVAGNAASHARGFGFGPTDSSAMKNAYDWCEKSAAASACHIEILRCAP
jgi:hypothetical protein